MQFPYWLKPNHCGQVASIGFGVALALTVTLPGDGALALDAYSPAPVTEPWPAPVGHRQPEVRDLPPQVIEDEGGDTRRQRDIDAERDLDAEINSICRGC
jgi:hypothetical protein